MADAGLIIGLALWRLRVTLTGKTDLTPPFLLRDSDPTQRFSNWVQAPGSAGSGTDPTVD